MKRSVFLLIIPIIILLVFSGSIYADEYTDDTYFSAEQVYLNPVYLDIFTEQDVIDNWQAPLLRRAPGDSGEPYTSWTDLAIGLRQKLKAFSPTVTLYIYSDISDDSTIFSKMRNAYELAAAHTGIPNEGDYLRWNNMGYEYGFKRSKTGNRYKYELSYKFTYLHNSAQETATTNALNSAYSSLSFSDNTAYSKTLAIYNYVIDNVEYDYDNLNDTSYVIKHSTYAAAVSHKAVCQGYASMMYRMLLMAEVGNRLVTSSTHAWNIVQVGSTYYQVDATWGDSNYQTIRDKYFLKKTGAWPDDAHSFESRYTTDEFTSEFPISENDYVYYPVTNAEITDSEGNVYEETEDMEYTSGGTDLYAAVDPASYARDIVWSTENTDLVTLTPSSDKLSCHVSYLNPGDATITMQTVNPEFKDSITLHIDYFIPAEALTVTDGSGEPVQSQIALDISETPTLTLRAAASPAQALQRFSWKSSNPKVASLSPEQGESTEITFHSIGTSIITVSALNNSGVSEEIELNVSGDNGNLGVTSITVYAPKSITIGKTGTVSADVYPENAANKTLKWSVSVNGKSTNLASLSNGLLTINKNMPAYSIVTVTAEALDGSDVTGSAYVLAGPKASGVTITDVSGEPLTGTKTLIRNNSQEMQLYAVVAPEDAAQEVTWKTSNKGIADVSEDGLVTFHKNGTVTITATAKDGSGKYTSFRLTGKTLVESITLSGPAKIITGKTGLITASVLPADAGNKNLRWSVSINGESTNLASVSSGKLKLSRNLPAGTILTVKAEATDGSGVYKTIPVEASPMPLSVGIKDSDDNPVPLSLTVSLNDSMEHQFRAVSTFPDNYEGLQEFSWKSASPKIAVVSEDGKVTFLKNGTVTITATAKDGSGKSASVKLTGKTYVETVVLGGPEKVAVGKSGMITASVMPSGASNKTLKWSVSIDEQNTRLASVSSAGKLILSRDLPAGTILTVKAEATDGSDIYDTIQVEASPIPQSVVIKDSEGNPVSGPLTLALNDSPTFQFNAESIFTGEIQGLQDFTWKSNAPKIAAVETGKVTFLKNGTVTITATAKDGSGKSASVKLTGKTYVETVTLSGPEKVAVGKSGMITASVMPSGASNKTLKWSVSIDGQNTRLASVSSAGKLTLSRDLPAGTILTVKAEATDGSFVSESFPVEASPVPQSVVIKDSEGNPVSGPLTLALNDSPTFQFNAESVFTGEVQGLQDFTWKSNAPKIAVVEDGQVTFLNTGTATISATAKDGSGKSSSVKLTGRIYVTEITINAPENMLPGSNAAISAAVMPSNANNKNITWSVLLNGQTSNLAYISNGKLFIRNTVPTGSEVTLTAKAADNYLYNGNFVTDVRTIAIGTATADSALQETAPLSMEAGEPPKEYSASDPEEEEEEEEILNEAVPADQETAENGIQKEAEGPILVEAAAGESVDLMAFLQTEEELVWAVSAARDGTESITIESGIAHIRPDAEPGSEIIVMAAAVNAPDNVYHFTIRIRQNVSAESTVSAESAEQAEELIPDEPAGSTETAGAIETVSFESGELELTTGEKRLLIFESEESLFFGSNDNEIAAVDPETGIVTAVNIGETMLYAAIAEPVEVKGLIHVTVKAAEPAEATDDVQSEGPEAPTETEIPAEPDTAVPDPEITENETVPAPVPEDPEEPETGEIPAEPDDTPAEPDDLPYDQPVPETGEEPMAVPEALTELRIKDLDESGISAPEGSLVTIERMRFEASDGELSGLIFKIENEAIARLEEYDTEEMLEKGIRISMLCAGETRMTIGYEAEEPLLRIPITVSTPEQEIILEPETITEESSVLPAEPEPIFLPEKEFVSEMQTEPSSEPVYEASAGEPEEVYSDGVQEEIIPQEEVRETADQEENIYAAEPEECAADSGE